MNLWKNITSKAKSLHHDEQGADLIEYVLIIAAIALPVLGVLIWFWKDISTYFNELWGGIKDGSDGTDPSEF